MSSFEIYGNMVTNIALFSSRDGSICMTYIIEFILISRPLQVDDIVTVSLISKVTALLFEIVLNLLFNIKVKEPFHDLEQLARIVE